MHRHPWTTHAWPSLPIIPDPYPTPTVLALSEQKYAAAELDWFCVNKGQKKIRDYRFYAWLPITKQCYHISSQICMIIMGQIFKKCWNFFVWKKQIKLIEPKPSAFQHLLCEKIWSMDNNISVHQSFLQPALKLTVVINKFWCSSSARHLLNLF